MITSRGFGEGVGCVSFCSMTKIRTVAMTVPRIPRIQPLSEVSEDMGFFLHGKRTGKVAQRRERGNGGCNLRWPTCRAGANYCEPAKCGQGYQPVGFEKDPL